ncbi:helix-turn-helix transcriptional regulator [Bradyrhizobium sp. WSM 1704]|uniref:AraC family transcriptional regulator n=1 Tax=Bradyrhizobium semiaridum TaxID=2821404 RepID=UPI001CE2E159|nr:AraC family transcriptional regulator [Bradyrhizobium semiaridum]MCA6121617.1 helix-turn-helix transcriptional regulator [Bradyrhizobium semiaridum]
MYTWSTEQIDPRDRFDYWREVRAKGLFGVTAELAPEHRRDFFGKFSLRKLGDAGLVEMRASPYRVERRHRDIADARSDSLCIYQQLGGGGWFSGIRHGDFAVRDGMFATSYADLPYRTVPLHNDGFHLRILKIPLASIPQPRRGRLDELAPKPVQDQTALRPLLESCFRDLLEGDDAAAPTETAPLITALAHIALIERGVLRSGSRLAQQALRTGRLSLARRLIEKHLLRPTLSPPLIADLLGISLRHLHVLFEAEEISFSETVTALRIERSRRLLRERPDWSITRVAFACGFESLATFYRLFNAAEQMTPGDYRAAGGSRAR